MFVRGARGRTPISTCNLNSKDEEFPNDFDPCRNQYMQKKLIEYSRPYRIRFTSLSEERDAKHRILQEQLENRRCSTKVLNKEELFAMSRKWNDKEPEGLQKNSIM
ncbi:hypothetical protein FQR65_LT07241 [Abscondita terminalis]|nr:hypothetical protein FQR65_LT07241 [Abscondita terminalis]